MITHVFLDAGNTLVFPNMDAVSRALARRGVRVEPARLRRSEHRVRRWLDDPSLIRRSTDDSRWTLYFDAILRGCGVNRPAAARAALRDLRAYHERHNLWEEVPPGLPMVLDRLRRRHRLAVVSNSNGTVREKLRRVGLWPYFETVVDSHEVGVEKPDPRIFRIAMERVRARPHESVYVGDLYHVDVAGARAAGMRALLVDPADASGDRPVPRIASLHDLPERLASLPGVATV